MKTIPLFNRFLKQKSEEFVGINLGNYSVKGLIVKNSEITDYFLEESRDLSSLLREVWQKKKISTNKVKLSIKNPCALTRYFAFPKIEKKKLRQAIFYELNKHIPFPPQEVYFDFAVLEETSSSEVFLLLAAAKKDFINRLIDVFTQEKLRILEINLDSISLVNLFLKGYKNESKINTCLLDIGYSFSTLTILKEGIPYLTRDLEHSAKDIFQTISHIKNTPFKEIEGWLCSLKKQDEFFKLAGSSMANLCKEVKNSFDYFELNKGERIEKIYLTGGLANIDGIADFFKDTLDTAVDILNNLQALDMPFPDDNFVRLKNNFSAVTGLIL